MNKIYSIGGVLLVIAAFLAGSYTHSNSTAPIKAGDVASGFTNGLVVGGGTYSVTPGYYVNGAQGVYTTSIRIPMFFGSTTQNTSMCSILSPAATTSLANFGINITTATTSAITFTLASSTNELASTSLLQQYTAAASAQASFAWDPSINSIMPPSTWINFTAQGNGSGSSTIANSGATPAPVVNGTCQASFVSLQN